MKVKIERSTVVAPIYWQALVITVYVGVLLLLLALWLRSDTISRLESDQVNQVTKIHSTKSTSRTY